LGKAYTYLRMPDLPDRKLAESCFEFLHIEMVDYFTRQSEALLAAGKDAKGFALEGKVANPTKQSQAYTMTKLDQLGYEVGHRLAERYSKDQSWLVEQLDIIKFICKEFWSALFKKQVDKLQTNYKGIYVLHDMSFRWIQHLSFSDGKESEAGPPAPSPASALLPSLTASQLEGEDVISETGDHDDERTPTAALSSSISSVAPPNLLSNISSVAPASMLAPPAAMAAAAAAAAAGTITLAPPSASSAQADRARLYTAFAAGILRGALQALGMTVTVRADIPELPQCQFMIIDVDKKKSTATRGIADKVADDKKGGAV